MVQLSFFFLVSFALFLFPFFFFSVSPCHRVSLSPPLRVSLSPSPRVSPPRLSGMALDHSQQIAGRQCTGGSIGKNDHPVSRQVDTDQQQVRLYFPQPDGQFGPHDCQVENENVWLEIAQAPLGIWHGRINMLYLKFPAAMQAGADCGHYQGISIKHYRLHGDHPIKFLQVKGFRSSAIFIIP
jgi:hypothetical protein